MKITIANVVLGVLLLLGCGQVAHASSVCKPQMETPHTGTIDYDIQVSFFDIRDDQTKKLNGVLKISQSETGIVSCIQTLHQTCASLRDFNIFINVADLVAFATSGEVVEQKTMVLEDEFTDKQTIVTAYMENWAYHPFWGDEVAQTIEGKIKQQHELPYDIDFSMRVRSN